jgi:uncharacterized protein (DUF2062 family)
VLDYFHHPIVPKELHKREGAVIESPPMNAPADTHPFNPAIIVPVHDTAGGLPALLDRLARIGLPVIIIDDDSTDGTSEAPEECGHLLRVALPASPSSGTPGEGRGGGSPVATANVGHIPLEVWNRDNRTSALVVHSHDGHRGRVHALRAGFAAAIKTGHTHALTLSGDFNDAPDQIQKLVAAAREHPHSLILATANKSHSRGLTSVLLSLEAGVHVHDPRRGLRVYPLSLVALAPCRANGTAYEIEILARAGWAKCPIIEVPINSNEGTRDTSGGLFVPSPGTPGSSPDTLREIAMHVRLLARRLSGWPHPKYRAGNVIASPPFWRGLGQWLNPLRAWRELRQGDIARNELAAGIAVGVFIANLPVFGVQTLLALYVARRLHLHPLAVVAGSKASTPPAGPLLVAAAIWLGHLLVHGSRLTWNGLLKPVNGHLLKAMLPLLLDWIVGATLIGTGMAVITFGIANVLFRSVPRRPDKLASP